MTAEAAEQKPQQSVLERIREKANRSRRASVVVYFEGEKIVVMQPTAKDYEEAEYAPTSLGANGQPLYVDPVSRVRSSRRLLMACCYAADAQGGTVGRIWPKSMEAVVMDMPLTDPLLSKLTEAFAGLSNAKSLEAEATKSP